MGHLKRQEAPTIWPVIRKGSKYIVRPTADFEKGMPLLVILREMLGVVENRKEAKQLIHEGKVLCNVRKARDETESVSLFDVITLVDENKSYKLDLDERNVFKLEETKENNKKIVKVVNKKMVKGNKIQLNFWDGSNLLYDGKIKVGDSCVLNMKDKKVEKILPVKKGAKVLVTDGRHLGHRGIIEEMNEEENTSVIELKDKKVNISNKNVMVLE